REQTRGAYELVRVPPEGRTSRRAARAEDAFVQPVELFPLFGRLQTLLFRRRRVVDQIRLDRMVLLEELAHVHDQVADHRQAGNRSQLNRLLELLQIGDASEPVLAVDVHRVGTADAFTA